MKKSITLILAAGFLFAMVFSCSDSNEGFESRIKSSTASNSQELCEAIGGKVLGPDEKCAGTYGLIPDFTCGWTPGIVAIGDTAVLSFTLESEDPNCNPKAFHISGGDTILFKLDSNYVISDSHYSSLNIYGHLHCAESTEMSIIKPCTSLEISPVPIPRIAGELRINVDDIDGNSSYYYIGTEPTIITYIEITNKEAAECGEIEYKWTNKNTAAPGIVEVIATAVCAGREYKLNSAMAMVVPDPVLSDCVWDSTNVVLYDGTTPIMHEDQPLRVSATLSNNHGRCGPVQYSFNRAAPSVNGSLDLYGLATYGESSSKALSAIAEVLCFNYNIEKTCSRVSDIYVAHYKNIVGGCEVDNYAQFTFNKGRTIFEFACEGNKGLNDLVDSYYINCGGVGESNFEVIVEGGATKGEGHNGWNFYPGLPAIRNNNDGLYHYPVPVLITTNVSGGIECGIW
jgi:hypothetical protein